MNTNELIQRFLNKNVHETHSENSYTEPSKKTNDNNDRCDDNNGVKESVILNYLQITELWGCAPEIWIERHID